jgi:hypothetical protein
LARCREAISLLEDVPQDLGRASVAESWALIAFAEQKRGRPDDARDAYRQAIDEGIRVVSPQKLDNWQAELDDLEKGMP